MATRSKEWSQLQNIPCIAFSIPLLFNQNEFILIDARSNRIFEYNAKSNDWTRICLEMDKGEKWEDLGATINPKNKIIYVYDHKKLYEIDSKKIHANIYDLDIEIDMAYPKMLVIKDKIYISSDELDHLGHTVDLSSDNNRIGEFPFITDLTVQFLTYLKSKNTILCVSTDDEQTKEFEINEYSLDQISSEVITRIQIEIDSDEVSQLKDHLCGNMFAGYAMTKAEDYLFILGGEIDDSGHNGDICPKNSITVYDLKRNECYETSIICPTVSGTMYAICMVDEELDELIMFGFVHGVYRLKQFDDMRHLPVYLIKMMSKWFCTEYVHILARFDTGSGRHWKINIDEILNKMIIP